MSLFALPSKPRTWTKNKLEYVKVINEERAYLKYLQTEQTETLST